MNQLSYRFHKPASGDIILFNVPEGANVDYKFSIKRVIAVGGDTVEVKDGKVFLNDKPIEEPYIKEPMEYAYEKVTVPENKLFVLGDNRNVALDSHKWGFIDEKDVEGRLCHTCLSFKRAAKDF